MVRLLFLTVLTATEGSVLRSHQTILAPQIEVFRQYQDTVLDFGLVLMRSNVATVAFSRSNRSEEEAELLRRIHDLAFPEYRCFQTVKVEYETFFGNLALRLAGASDEVAKAIVHAAIPEHLLVLEQARTCTEGMSNGWRSVIRRNASSTEIELRTRVLRDLELTDYGRLIRATFEMISGLIDILQGQMESGVSAAVNGLMEVRDNPRIAC